MALSLVLAACGADTDGSTATEEDADTAAADADTAAADADTENDDDAGTDDDTVEADEADGEDSDAATAGEGDAATTDDELPLVIVTTTILGDIVANVAGDEAMVEVLMPLGADPHAFEASAQQAALMRDADLIIANGIGLEEGLLDAIDGAQDDGTRVLAVGESLDPMPFDRSGDDDHDHGDDDDHDHGDDDHDHGDDDHDHGDDDHGDEEHDHGDDDHGDEEHSHEGGLDAHVWMDPVRMAEAVDLIATELDDVADGDFLARGASYRGELDALHEDIEAMIATVPEADRKLVTNHFAYGYYADRYGLEMLGTVIPAATTEAETSAAEFAELIEIIDEADVPAIFASTTEPVTLAEAIAEEVGRDVQVLQLYTGSLGEEGSGAETYIGMMTTSTERMVEGLTS